MILQTVHSYDTIRSKVQASFFTITRLHAKTCVFRQGGCKGILINANKIQLPVVVVSTLK